MKIFIWLMAPFGVAGLCYLVCMRMTHVWPGVVTGFVMSLSNILLLRPWRKRI